MPQNLEVKARVPSLSQTLPICKRIGAKRQGILYQRDTYFSVRRGRLKLREINGRQFELISYTRPTRTGKRYSDYVVIPLTEPRAVKALCKSMFGVKAIIVKERTLFLYKNARIQLDKVRGLGSFIEFEVIVRHGKRQARQLMNFLIAEFGISRGQTIGGSYAEMR